MVAHNCHGKRITVTSRQKEKPHGKKKKTHGKTNNLTAKGKTSRQKEKDSRQKERLAAKLFRCREDILILIAFAVRSWLLFLWRVFFLLS